MRENRAEFGPWDRFNYACSKILMPSIRTPEDRVTYIGFLLGVSTVVASVALTSGIEAAGYRMEYEGLYPIPRISGPGGTQGFELVVEGYISPYAVVRALQNNMRYRTASARNNP